MPNPNETKDSNITRTLSRLGKSVIESSTTQTSFVSSRNSGRVKPSDLVKSLSVLPESVPGHPSLRRVSSAPQLNQTKETKDNNLMATSHVLLALGSLARKKDIIPQHSTDLLLSYNTFNVLDFIDYKIAKEIIDKICNNLMALEGTNISENFIYLAIHNILDDLYKIADLHERTEDKEIFSSKKHLIQHKQGLESNAKVEEEKTKLDIKRITDIIITDVTTTITTETNHKGFLSFLLPKTKETRVVSKKAKEISQLSEKELKELKEIPFYRKALGFDEFSKFKEDLKERLSNKEKFNNNLNAASNTSLIILFLKHFNNEGISKVIANISTNTSLSGDAKKTLISLLNNNNLKELEKELEKIDKTIKQEIFNVEMSDKDIEDFNILRNELATYSINNNIYQKKRDLVTNNKTAIEKLESALFAQLQKLQKIENSAIREIISTIKNKNDFYTLLDSEKNIKSFKENLNILINTQEITTDEKELLTSFQTSLNQLEDAYTKIANELYEILSSTEIENPFLLISGLNTNLLKNKENLIKLLEAFVRKESFTEINTFLMSLESAQKEKRLFRFIDIKACLSMMNVDCYAEIQADNIPQIKRLFSKLSSERHLTDNETSPFWQNFGLFSLDKLPVKLSATPSTITKVDKTYNEETTSIFLSFNGIQRKISDAWQIKCIEASKPTYIDEIVQNLNHWWEKKPTENNTKKTLLEKLQSVFPQTKPENDSQENDVAYFVKQILEDSADLRKFIIEFFGEEKEKAIDNFIKFTKECNTPPLSYGNPFNINPARLVFREDLAPTITNTINIGVNTAMAFYRPTLSATTHKPFNPDEINRKIAEAKNTPTKNNETDETKGFGLRRAKSSGTTTEKQETIKVEELVDSSELCDILLDKDTDPDLLRYFFEGIFTNNFTIQQIFLRSLNDNNKAGLAPVLARITEESVLSAEESRRNQTKSYPKIDTMDFETWKEQKLKEEKQEQEKKADATSASPASTTPIESKSDDDYKRKFEKHKNTLKTLADANDNLVETEWVARIKASLPQPAEAESKQAVKPVTLSTEQQANNNKVTEATKQKLAGYSDEHKQLLTQYSNDDDEKEAQEWFDSVKPFTEEEKQKLPQAQIEEREKTLKEERKLRLISPEFYQEFLKKQKESFSPEMHSFTQKLLEQKENQKTIA